MRWSLNQVGDVLKQSVSILAMTVILFGVVPALAISTSVDQVRASELPTIESIRDQLESRLDDLKDIRTILTLKQYDPKTKAVVNEAEMELQAVLPSVARLTFRRPDILRGNVYVLDYAADEVYSYYPLFDLAECSRLDAFLETSPMQPAIDGLFSLPNGDDLGRIDVLGVEKLDGAEYVVLRVEPSERVLSEGLDDLLEDTLQSAMGLQVEMGASDIMYVWVDLDQHFIRQMKVFNADDELVVSVEANGVSMDQGLSSSTLKLFRGAEIRRCR